MRPGQRVVAVGGGHGLARALAAVRLLDVQPTAVVTTADDGGSSGRLRRDLGIIPPGDLRMALLSLARDEHLAGALAHRFQRGQLRGHALGNLLLVALAEQSGGNFVAALDRAAALLDCAGRVLPATTDPVHLKARVSGEQVDGQARVTRAGGHVERVWLEPLEPDACPQAVAAIADADAVLLGPGSLFTSVIAALLVPEIAAALTATAATVVYVGNLLTQPGETSGLDAAGHIEALSAHVPGLVLDAVVLHDGPAGAGHGAPLGTALPEDAGLRRVCADLATRGVAGEVLAAHDPARLAAALAPLLRRSDWRDPSPGTSWVE